jgi:hypothetical protein
MALTPITLFVGEGVIGLDFVLDGNPYSHWSAPFVVDPSRNHIAERIASHTFVIGLMYPSWRIRDAPIA